MKDRLLLVPGTSGCKLLNNGVDIGWPAELRIMSWMSVSALERVANVLGYTPQKIQKLLSMEFADPALWFPTKTTLAPGGSIGAGPVLSAAYNQFSDYATFPYDWRSDVRGSAKQLLRFLKDGKPTGGRWRIVAHSQGALLVVIASKLYAKQNNDRDDAFSSDLVSRFVSLASPLHGTVNSADALIRGSELGGPFRRHFLKAVRTWPAIYQMLPTWRGSIRPGPGVGPTNYSALNPKAWEGIDVDLELLTRAKETRRKFLINPLSRMRGAKIRIVMSRAHPTRNHLVRTNSGLELPPDEGPDSEPGDTLVPYDTTVRSMGEIERDRHHGFGDDGNTAVHFMVANDPVLSAEVKNFLE